MTRRSDPASVAQGFLDSRPFAPDPFQRKAVAACAAGASVVVTAPTGSGKTLVAEAGVEMTLAAGRRAFYTTPIKALSNQKFGDFRAMYGARRVGLLTGDNVVNGNAPIVVMTTEVLRNMIYAESDALEGLGLVVLDEVHYLQDRARGQVWEEVIIHLPREVPLMCLSATIANPEEFTGWVRARRGPTELVVETDRPVPLESLFLVKDRNRESALELFSVFDRRGDRPNPDVVRLLKRGRGRRRRFVAPRRLETVELLHRELLLPAIYFIFSRTGCNQAAQLVANASPGLVTATERAEIRRVVTERTRHLPEGDLAVLGYPSFAANLEAGVSAHHAGMVPAFKETVEELFSAGLVKVVFATETLALGINMPARTVVLERLSKFTGETHEILQPGDYTQLTGRAGRRGIDRKGTAVVLHDRDVPFERLAAIAAAGSHPLRSSFEPTYNMAVNLVANYPQARAEELLHASFAQYRTQEHRAQLTARIGEEVARRDEARAAAECDRGDIWDYAATSGSSNATADALRDFAMRTAEGDVVSLTGAPRDRWVVLARGWGSNPRLLVLSAAGEVRRLRPDQLTPSVLGLGTMTLPEPVQTRDTAYRRTVARTLAGWEPGDDAVTKPEIPDGGHPVASCPSLSEHLEWVRRARSADREIRRLRRRQERGGTDVVARFRSLLGLLEDWGYTEGWHLTRRGERLRFVYNELDVLLAESVERGLFAELTAAELAALASLFTYEARLSDVEGGWPSTRAMERGGVVLELAAELNTAEHARRIPETRYPDSGFADRIHSWCSGAALDDLFDDDGSAGDFVRNCRQLLDLLRQVRDAYPDHAEQAREAIAAIDRGVVAVGGML